MKKPLVAIMLFSACAYGMEKQNATLTNARALDNSNSSTHIILKSNESQEMLDKAFLPETWYRQLAKRKLVQEYDQTDNPLIILQNVSPEILSFVKNALYLMKFLLLVNSEHKGTQVAYKYFQALHLSLDKAAELLVILNYLRVPKALLAGLAKLFVQLTQGEEPDLGLLNDEVKKEINRYFYLFYNTEIEGRPQGDRHLQDLLEFDKLDTNNILSLSGHTLHISGQELASVCSMNKLIKIGIIPTLLKILDLSNNHLEEVPANLVKYCHQLQCLDLSNNQLKAIPADLVKYCPKLEYLILANNKLKKVPIDLVKHCLELITLNLSNNQLKEIPTNLVKYCPKLRELYFSNNLLKEVPVNLLKYLKLSELYLEIEKTFNSKLIKLVFICSLLLGINLLLLKYEDSMLLKIRELLE